MSKAFTDFMDQYRSVMMDKFENGVSSVSLADSCGHGAQRDAATEPILPHLKHLQGERLDAVAGRVQAANRLIAKFGICPEGADCLRADPQLECRLWECDQCGDGKLRCALCYELHYMEPHVTDAMNAASGKG